TPSMPSVTMKGGIAPLVMRNPFTQPVNAPIARHPAIPIHQGRSRLEVSIAPTTPDSARIDPTDRSMPADEMTKVMPIASTPNTDVESRMLRTFETERKAFDSAAITAQSTARTISDSSRTAAPPANSLRQDDGPTETPLEVMKPGPPTRGHRRPFGEPNGRLWRRLLHVLQQRVLVGLDHLFGQHERRDVGHLGDLVACEDFLRVLDRLHTDQIGQLGDRSVEPPGLDRFDGVGVAVDADDDQLILAGRAGRLDRAEGHVVIGAEDRDEAGRALPRVVGDVGRLQAV